LAKYAAPTFGHRICTQRLISAPSAVTSPAKRSSHCAIKLRPAAMAFGIYGMIFLLSLIWQAAHFGRRPARHRLRTAGWRRGGLARGDADRRHNPTVRRFGGVDDGPMSAPVALR